MKGNKCNGSAATLPLLGWFDPLSGMLAIQTLDMSDRSFGLISCPDAVTLQTETIKALQRGLLVKWVGEGLQKPSRAEIDTLLRRSQSTGRTF